MTDSDSSNSGPTELQSQRAAAQSVTAQLDSLWQARWLDCRESYRAAERSLAALGHRDDPDSIAVSYRALAWCARWKGEFLLARDYCDRALRHLATSPNADIEGAVLSILAQVEFCLGDPAAAIARVDRGMQVIADVSAGETHIDLLSTDAALLRYQNETARAAEVLQSALQIASGRFPNDVLRVKCNMARLQAQLGDLVAARATAEHLLNKVVGTPGHLLLGYTYEVLGSVALLQKDMDAAKQYIEAGLMLAVDRGDKRLECEIRGCVASYHTANGDLTRALDSARTGLQVAESLKFRLWEVIYLEQVAGLYEQLGEFSKALTWYKRFHDQKSAILTSSFTLRERQQQSARQVQLLQSESMLASEKDSLIKVENDKRERMRRELSWASIRDNLSGLLKREAFDRKLTTLTHETRGSADQHVLLYIDVDNFASFNDELGYGAGDRLRDTAWLRLSGCATGSAKVLWRRGVAAGGGAGTSTQGHLQHWHGLDRCTLRRCRGIAQTRRFGLLSCQGKGP